ncbi:HNH endonuclease family protein [Rhodococcus sp. F64268]|uniref:HNH endonuclease family protein n=1 Tax=Rhodococcus sp. F64268 TaxID=2926402 RepID=UPI001FF58AF7|nr:HNH endonuclease family protein [Rhodococcus sp. F64268]MCK0092666.1 HNH endonuclease family protein [Rhodococcus sp. F64268]
MRGGNAKWWVPAVVIAMVVSWWFDSSPPPSDPAPGSPSRALIDELLAAVTVVSVRPHPGGYVRDCGGEGGCVFGEAWTDEHPGPGGRDGCDTRNNVLARDLRDVVFRPGSDECVVLSGTLDDPYTGARVQFRRTHANAVHIDHIYPLAAAWDHGAAQWSAELRRQFANDMVYNLIAVDGATNMTKRDHTPAAWLPPATGYRCWFAGKYLTVALRYGLPITVEDHSALADSARTCPR